MSFCPEDLKPCIDDLCRGSGNCIKSGESMLTPCPGCRQLVATDGSDNVACKCDFEDDPDADYPYDYPYCGDDE